MACTFGDATWAYYRLYLLDSIWNILGNVSAFFRMVGALHFWQSFRWFSDALNI